MTAVPATTMMATQIAVLVAAAEKHLLDQLRAAGATDPSRAVALEVRNDMETSHLRTLTQRAIVVESGPGRYYLDEAALKKRSRVGRGGALALAAAVVLVCVALALVIWTR
jgi:hypothetical protein